MSEPGVYSSGYLADFAGVCKGLQDFGGFGGFGRVWKGLEGLGGFGRG